MRTEAKEARHFQWACKVINIFGDVVTVDDRKSGGMGLNELERSCQVGWSIAPSHIPKLVVNICRTPAIFYPLVNKRSELENGHRNSGFSHRKWWIFP